MEINLRYVIASDNLDIYRERVAKMNATVKIKADKNGVARFYAMNVTTGKFRVIDSYSAFLKIEKLGHDLIDETPDAQPNAWWK